MAGGAVARAWTPVAFEGPARGVVHALKFRGALGLADLMAAQMVATAPPWLLAPGVALVPVPTTARPRGAARLRPRRRASPPRWAARRACAVVALPARAGPARRVRLGAARAARRADGRPCGSQVRAKPPAAAVLIDDVHTTGATLDACARHVAGARCVEVSALAYARALR